MTTQSDIDVTAEGDLDVRRRHPLPVLDLFANPTPVTTVVSTA